MQGIIVYKGKYGATQQYAEWLSATLNLPAHIPGEITTEQLAGTDFIVLGSSVYIGKLQLAHWLKQNAVNIINKKLFLFVVCGTPPEKKEKIETYLQASVPSEIRNKCEVYILPGRLVLNKLSWLDRLLLKMGARFTKDNEEKKNMLTEYDDVKKENLDSIINAIEKFMFQNKH